MKDFLTWGVDGEGRRLFLCHHCGFIFGYHLYLFEEDLEHECE